ncbi:histidine phosphatase family protein [Candidatus Woesearchaeota archaeon]|nr:histidine phosphatase family protein [Candidatus Woesearchaeota archaeon]
MKLILVRHGETIENREGIMQGHLPGKLTPRGIRNAKLLAIRLKDEKIDCIYSSDLARAADTTKEIIRFHPNVPVKFVKELRERNLGEFQGRKVSDYPYGTYPKNWPEPKFGETRRQLFERARLFLAKILAKHAKDTILLVCHGSIGSALHIILINQPLEKLFSYDKLGSTAMSIYEVNKKGNNKVILFNSTDHIGNNV